MIQMYLQKNQILTYKKLVNGLFNGKRNFILIPTNRQMRIFFLEKQTTTPIPLFLSITMTSVNVPRNALLPIYTSFIRPHLYYSDVLYDKPEKENFKIRKSSIQSMPCYNQCNTRKSRQKRYNKLGLHSLSKRRWRKKLTFL